ncbi:hypothetical protein [Nocardioides sp. W7]|uniref:hypothetical protein n=1 Tax=Nocardioides sp. W7 TaxID=2931390 RepID=UPI001FD1BFAD|nr:hypothetical protein [Nocardioides sp. W7]
MSNAENENEPGVPDEDLPEDLVPSDDNPLAEGLEPGSTVEDLLTGGKAAEQEGKGEPKPGDAAGEGRHPSDTSQEE